MILIFLVFFLLYFLFIGKAGKIYPILYLFVFTYFIQYVFSVYLIYNEYPVLRKQMTISQEQLFDYLVPALLCLFAGVFLFNKDFKVVDLMKNIDRKRATKLGHILLFISFSFDFLSLIGLPQIGSIVSFTHCLKYAGAMCYLFSPSPLNYFLLALSYLGLISDVLANSIFIDFFIWGTFLFFMICLVHKFSVGMRLSFIIYAVPLVVLIQSVKFEYRNATWSGKKESGVGLITEIAGKKQNEMGDDPFAKSEGVIRTVGRLNQGWHLGMVLKQVPKRQDFSYGSDMWGDIVGSILPRIFFPNKKTIGSQDKFFTYTGHKLTKGTSMTIGLLGDFYINFGKEGAFVGLFIFGAVISRFLYFFIKKHVVNDPLNIIWIPFLFNYLVRANNDFYVVFNNLVKGYLIFLAVSYLQRKFWPDHPVLKNLR
jgi:hypothetical protein